MGIQVGPRGRKQAWAAHLEEAMPTNLVVVVQLLSRVRLCDPMDCSTPDSVRLSRQEDLEWVSVSFFRGSSRIRDRTCISCMGRRILYHRCPPIFRRAVKTQVLNRSRAGPRASPPLGGADGAVPRRSLERPVGPGICGCESFLRAVGRTQDATEETGLWLPLCRQRVES